MAEFEISRDNIDVIAFDWDGTVVDTVPYKLKHNQAIAAEFGNTLSLDEVRTIWAKTPDFPALMQQLTGSTDMAAIMSVIERDYNNPEYAKREFEFSKQTLRTVRSLGYSAVLLTSASRQVLDLDQHLLEFDLGQYFDYVQSSDDSVYKKPDSRFFDGLLETQDVEPNRVVYIGDELKDGEAARSAGAHFIGVETGMDTKQEFADNGFSSVENIAKLALK